MGVMGFLPIKREKQQVGDQSIRVQLGRVSNWDRMEHETGYMILLAYI